MKERVWIGGFDPQIERQPRQNVRRLIEKVNALPAAQRARYFDLCAKDVSAIEALTITLREAGK